jgi:hypothetical protein
VGPPSDAQSVHTLDLAERETRPMRPRRPLRTRPKESLAATEKRRDASGRDRDVVEMFLAFVRDIY